MENPSKLLQWGIYQEEIRGDLEAALRIYEEIINRFPKDKEICARAQYRIGICLEKMGSAKAAHAFRRVIVDYPRQFQWVDLAKEKLKKNPPTEIDPLVQYYFERNPPDPLTSISYDGQWLAYTDWSTGNLMIRDLNTGRTLNLTDIDGFREKKFFFHPAWSRDGTFIACSMYRELDSLDLYIINVKSREKHLICTGKKERIYPQDWTPDNRNILCHIVYPSSQEKGEELLLISRDGVKKKLINLGLYSRGLKFSPSGETIAYDLLKEGRRHIYLHLVENNEDIRVTSGITSEIGFDNPRWWKNGKLLLYRSNQRNRYDLWAAPVSKGKPIGKPRLVRTNIIEDLLKMKKIDHTKVSVSKVSKPFSDFTVPAPEAFEEDFSGTSMDKTWSVFEWDQPNIYGYDSFGCFSLTDNPGCLRYYLGPATILGARTEYLPLLDSYWYWYYPAMEVSYPFQGNSWKLEFKVAYFSVAGLNSRSISAILFLNPNDNSGPNIFITRYLGRNELWIEVKINNEVISKAGSLLHPADKIDDPSFNYRFRIYRVDNLIRVDLSPRGEEFKTVLSAELPEDLLGKNQRISLSGSSWYVPALAFADYDYVRLIPLKKKEIRQFKKEFKKLNLEK